VKLLEPDPAALSAPVVQPEAGSAAELGFDPAPPRSSPLRSQCQKQNAGKPHFFISQNVLTRGRQPQP